MESKDHIVIIIISLWLISVLITGILALIFKGKYKSFKQNSNLINEEFKNQQNLFKLKEVLIDFELPKDEKCYFFQKEVNLIKLKLKNNKDKIDYKKELKESKLNCSLYITNKRVMIQLNDKYFQYNLENIVYCSHILFYFKKNWIFSTQLEINDDKYIMGTDNFDLLLTVKKLGNKGD
ncbi:hypothetical protein [Spiroplasma monobiae]|nr:hypothetical protein [Spiroplasma monobiae]